MKKIISLLEKLNLPFGVDKQLHFLAGFIISAIVILITGSIAAAGFDWKDLLATMIGGVIPSLIKIFLL